MNAQTSNHRYADGQRVFYTGTQDWGPQWVRVVKEWGGITDPMYVVQLSDGHTYVAAQSELHTSLSLSKPSDGGYAYTNGVAFNATRWGLPGHHEGMRMNDPITLASVFKITGPYA